MNTLSPSSSGTYTTQSDVSGVVQAYDILALAQSVGGIQDFTDGKYAPEDKDDWPGYLRAQERQANYLLDEVDCDNRSAILDIGCGYGRILATARRRGAQALAGVTLSPPQAAFCRTQDLDVRTMNYRDIPRKWGGFSGIVGNGSIEHFVRPKDAASGLADRIYREMFGIFHRLLVPGGKAATTVIHFRNQSGYDPNHIMYDAHPRYSAKAQLRLLFEALPGWYPVGDQLERCARGKFKLIREEDGTEDYRRTSEFWLRQIKKKFTRDPRAMFILAKAAIRRDATWHMIRCWAIDQAWEWQFRPGKKGEQPPVILLRQTWQRVD